MEALDFISNQYYHEIDVIVKSILFVVNKDKIKIEEVGRNGIGWFNLTYHVQNLDGTNAYGQSFDLVTTTITKPVPNTHTTIIMVDNSTDQQLAESSSSLWAWIAVAI